jgi:hypothetical protein
MRKITSPKKTRSTSRIGLWLLVFVMVISNLFETAQAATGDSSADYLPGPLVRLQSANGLAIDFRTQNGQTVAGKTPEVKEIPHLVLFRNGSLTAAEERTLQVTLSGLQVPASGATVVLEVETQHGDPDQGGNDKDRLLVWEHIEQLSGDREGETANLTFKRSFGGTIEQQGERVVTPTGYFRTEIGIYEGTEISGEPALTIVEEYAFLMESQWVAPLSGLAELSPGAAPDELVIYFSDTFAFQQDPYAPETRLPRAAVHAYVQEELGPALVTAVRAQTNEWGFAWHEDWTGFRGGADRDRLSVALARGGLWFHGMAPTQAHGGISINLEGADRVTYDSLTDWIVSVFHHELFHNLQRNQNLAHGNDGDVDGKNEAWEFLTEGTAVVAASAGSSEIEFAGSEQQRAYISRANRFLAGDRFYSDDLKTSYKEINPYNTAIYWRFLYEQCSGAQGAQGDLEIGMQVIRQTLNTLYASDDLEDVSREELVQAIPTLMDQVFSKASWCPFRSYEESLVHFSRAIYALRLEGGRCERAAGLAGCGFYDPNGLYAQPQVEEIVYAGERQVYESEIGGSFGMAFLEIVLDPQANGGGLRLAFLPAAGGEAAFSVQVWKLESSGDGRLARIPTQVTAPDVLASAQSRDAALYEIGLVDTGKYERLGLAITRLDSRENLDPVGTFTLSLEPSGSSIQMNGD